ncbi:uncharacterized protein N7498_008615 [Penicillium cinerascens]|uniref:ML-like domain-containing protein n=1 Tax=Penicillium cinerascens TaxID=70096 RepID=A0A9W9JFS9_9EURO|nr:uncharacterized protein N7498_008615 [Penicillium cinerascens]KAJ5195177.1 hypothetical protein N7498_008615 [Penicillium cinerascens]
MRKTIWALLGLGVLPQSLAADTLSTKGFNLCMTDSDIKVTNLDVVYTRSTKEVVFDVAGTNSKRQNVTASLTVTAYGNQIYSKTFDPCGDEVHVDKLCPVPSGSFSAQGSIVVPENYASQIPSIAFNIPDLDGQAKLTLTSKDTDEDVACVESELSNGKSTSIKAVAWASAGIAAGALALSGISALGAAGHPGAHSSSPGFGDVMGWFHSMATNGMLSVAYPTVYTSFTKNFAWSTGLISWGGMQNSIDSFRRATGGNLTQDNYVYLTSLSDSSSNGSSSTKRSLNLMLRAVDLVPRSMDLSDSSSSNGSSSSGSSSLFSVSGIKSAAEEAMIPSANVFMTVLLVFAIVVAVIVVGILLLKIILETWALYGNFPKKLSNFRKDYWGIMARTITNMILVLYSIWVLYCIYQLRNGDSWAAKLLAAVTLVVFTAVLAFFGWRIIHMARKYKKAEGDATSLYDNKDTWRKYSLFYDNYKKDFWWLFVPIIVYALAKGCIIAGAQGHGLAQSAGQLVVEALLLILLLWNRPYATKSSMGINITIQIVRVLSIACVLVFVEELGLSQTTKTVTGIVLIVLQSTLTGVLAILIAVNAVITCIRENPHAKRRKEAEKNNRDLDDLTPLDARESLLIEHPQKRDFTEMSKFNFTGPYEPYRDLPHRSNSTGSNERLVYADYGVAHTRNSSQQSRHSGRRSPSLEGRQPTKPGYGMAY